MKKSKKRLHRSQRSGELNLSFGMIFSIILIIAFLAFSFYAIKKFLSFQETVKIEKFFNDFQADIDGVWKSSQASQQVEYFLPRKIKAVCFTEEDESENLFFDSEKRIPGTWIAHIDMEKILDEASEPHSVCFETEEGRIKMRLQKDYEDILITIVKAD